MKWELIWRDLLVLGCIVLAISNWNNGFASRSLWLFLAIYNLVKQVNNHYIYYKATKKYY